MVLPPFLLFHSEDVKLFSRSSSLPGLKDGFNFVQCSDLMANSNNASTNIWTHYRKSFPSFWESDANLSERWVRASMPQPPTENCIRKVFWEGRRDWQEMRTNLQRTFSCHQSEIPHGVFGFCFLMQILIQSIQDWGWDCISFFVLDFFFQYLFIYLAALGLSCGMQDLSCGMWDLVPRPGIEPGPPALGARSLNHWTTREVPTWSFYIQKMLGQDI